MSRARSLTKKESNSHKRFPEKDRSSKRRRPTFPHAADVNGTITENTWWCPVCFGDACDTTVAISIHACYAQATVLFHAMNSSGTQLFCRLVRCRP